jgi:hypothetical protein
MNGKRKVESSARDALRAGRRKSWFLHELPSCEVQVLDMKDEAVASKAREPASAACRPVVVTERSPTAVRDGGRTRRPPGGRDREPVFVIPREL